MASDIFRTGTINVGASAFRMYIAEYSDGEEKALDYLVKPLRLGSDTFTQGYISLENVKKAVEILVMFRLKLEEYGITDYRAVCSSGVREARNKDFFLDYTYMHSGIRLEILAPAEEVYIKYISARKNVPDFKQMEKEGLVFANVSSGNVTLNITRKDLILYAGTLPYGSLRLRQMFSSISHIKRHKAIEEYVRIMINRLITAVDPSIKLKHLLGSGSSINMMIRLFNVGDKNTIKLSDIQDIYASVKTMSMTEIQQSTGLRKDEATVLIPTLITYMQLLNIVGGKHFTFNKLVFPQMLSHYYSGYVQDPQASLRISRTLISIAKRYRANVRHARWVNSFAEKLFEELHDLHALGDAYKVVLEAAALLNDVGYYVSDDNLAANSLYIIRSIDIPGADPDMLRFAACVVFEANREPQQRDPQEYAALDRDEILSIRKLAAILRLAKTLDYSQKRYIYSIEISMGDQIIIYANAEREPYLEIYTFDQQKQLFIETFGVSVDLRARVKYD